MAITKIHPIKSTLHLAIDYITRSDKTDEKLLVSTHKCHTSTAHIQFLKRREQFNTRGTVLARHLIQSFLPGETTANEAHRIGIELCKKILKNEYEFVIATHIDKGHIHNHIIFNNVNKSTGKCYQSNKRTYHKIRYQSDKLCKEYGLSVIDEYYESYKNKYKINGKSWYEYKQQKQGNSWKSKLQFDIDRTIKKAKDWNDFIKLMRNLDYEIKFGKHISFKHKDKKRYTRSKTIGEDYTEDNLKLRLETNIKGKTKTVKKRIGNIIDKRNNKKVLESKGYDFWATKHNLKTMSDTVLLIREKGINSKTKLDNYIKDIANKIQNLQDEIKIIENEMIKLSNTMENVNIVNKYHKLAKLSKEDPNNKLFNKEYISELKLYNKALQELKKDFDNMPSTKDILLKLDNLNLKKNTLIKKYSLIKNDMNELYKISKNYETYINKNNNLEI